MKTYTEEFKKTIVELYEAGNKTKTELAREYGTSECNVRGWIKKYGKIKTLTGEITTNDEMGLCGLLRIKTKVLKVLIILHCEEYIKSNL